MRLNKGFQEAGKQIIEGKITTLAQLYSFVTKRAIAEILDVSPVRFSNVNSKIPEDFSVGQIIKLSQKLSIPPEALLKIILNS